MKLARALALVFLATMLQSQAPSPAPATRTTQAKPSAADLKPNDPKVPDAYALNGHISRVVVMRLKYQSDLLQGIEKLVKQQNIRNAVILSGIG